MAEVPGASVLGLRMSGEWPGSAREQGPSRCEEIVMNNGEQGETVTVQDRPADDADVTATDATGTSSPAGADSAESVTQASSPDSDAADSDAAAAGASVGSA